MTVYAARIPSPIGTLTALVDQAGALTRLLFDGQPAPDGVTWDADRCAPVCEQLGAYFRGERAEFDLPLAPAGSDFQRRVWEVLRGVPFGATTSYRDVAALAGRPGAARAAGRANATNPIPIVIPCHRVVGTDGGLTGYGGGLEVKARLLELEGCRVERGRVFGRLRTSVELDADPPRIVVEP